MRQAIIIIIMQAGQPVGGARVRVAERAKDLVASSRGEFWRLLTPGEPTCAVIMKCSGSEQAHTPSGRSLRRGAVSRCRFRLWREKLAKGLTFIW